MRIEYKEKQLKGIIIYKSLNENENKLQSCMMEMAEVKYKEKIIINKKEEFE